MIVNKESAHRKFWLICLIILSAVYLLNCLAPLRLTNDTVRYFRIVAIAEGVWPASYGMESDFLPHGYVYFLLLLSRLNILNPFVICFFQLLYMAGALYYVAKVFKHRMPMGFYLLFVMLNWTTIKFTLVPLSETQFLFFTMGAICYFQQYMETKKIQWLVLMVLFCAIAFFTRTAGIALILSILATWLISIRGQIQRYIREHKMMAIGFTILVVSLVVYLIGNHHVDAYLEYFLAPFGHDPLAAITGNFRGHLLDWAELIINVPYTKTLLLFNPGLATGLFIIAGFIFLVIMIVKTVHLRKEIPLIVLVYLVGYSLLLFNWPFYEARFWLPVLPLIAAVFLMSPPANTLLRWLETAYKGIYLLAGLVMLSYYTWLAFDKQNMAIQHDTGRWQSAYEAHFFNKPFTDTTYRRNGFFVLEEFSWKNYP